MDLLLTIIALVGHINITGRYSQERSARCIPIQPYAVSLHKTGTQTCNTAKRTLPIYWAPAYPVARHETLFMLLVLG